MKRLIFPLTLLRVAAAAPAFATEPAHDGRASCPMHDKSLSDAERTEAMGKMFDQLDADHDGSISRAEIDAHHVDMRDKHAQEHGDKHEH